MQKNTTILGIDPGTTRIGYGIVQKTGTKMVAVTYGVIETEGGLNGLKKLEKQLKQLIQKYKPTLAAVEKIYFSKNKKTAISVAEARGVILLVLCKKNLKILEYTPSDIKAALCGSGSGDKKMVSKYTALALGMDKIEGYDDASDALAVAVRAGFERVC